MEKTKTNVIIGVAIGVLAGFVFGMAFTTSDTAMHSTGKVKGKVSELSKIRHQTTEEETQQYASTDTIRLTATDEQGKIWNVTMTKAQ